MEHSVFATEYGIFSIFSLFISYCHPHVIKGVSKGVQEWLSWTVLWNPSVFSGVKSSRGIHEVLQVNLLQEFMITVYGKGTAKEIDVKSFSSKDTS